MLSKRQSIKVDAPAPHTRLLINAHTTPRVVWAFFLLSFLYTLTAQAQQQTSPKTLLRLYMDNDFFAYRKEDGGYSNGLKLDLFYERLRREKRFLDKFFLQAGTDAIHTRSWSIMQVMITSNDITKEEWAQGDYPYSGSLFVTHALYAVNPNKQYAVKTEWLAGIMGPHAYAGETQAWFHDLIGDGKPMGWHHQMKTSVLINLNVSVEKLVFSPFRALEVIAGGDLYAGTMYNAATIQTLVRLGRMNPYFSGVTNRVTSVRGFQGYFAIKPQVSLVAHNTLLEGSIFKSDHPGANDADGNTLSESEASRFVAGVDYGIVLAYRRIGFSFTLNTNTGLVRDQPVKSTGNVSLYLAL